MLISCHKQLREYIGLYKNIYRYIHIYCIDIYYIYIYIIILLLQQDESVINIKPQFFSVKIKHLIFPADLFNVCILKSLVLHEKGQMFEEFRHKHVRNDFY